MLSTAATMVPMEYVEKINILIKAGAFSIDSGKVEVNVHNGQIQSVNINQTLYKRTKKVV